MFRQSSAAFLFTLVILGLSVPALAQSNSSSGSTSGSAPSQEVPVQLPSTKSGTGVVTSPASATATSSTAAPALNQQFRVNAPSFGPFKLRAGIKSTETSARAYEYKEEGGRRLKQKHEYYLGAVHKSGYGAYGQGVTSGTNFSDDRRAPISGSDASVTVLHPDFYKGTSLTLSGQFRRYFAISDRSKSRDQKQWAYYLYTTYKLPASWSVWNQATPRFFDQDFYKKGDTTYYFEDITNLTKALSQSFAVGIGQWTQVEWHARAETGISVDATLFARYTPIGNVWIEPRISLPAYIKNTVFDAARTPALDAARAELYAQITL